MERNRVNMETMPLRRGHFRVLVAASLGQVTGAALSTLIGVMLPMIQLFRHPELTSFQQGGIACMSLIGIMIGSILVGRWSDKHGYLIYFRLCPLIIFAASIMVLMIDSIAVLTAGLLIMGLGIGGEYSLDSNYISEIMPHKWRQLMVGVAKAASSIGNIAAAGTALLLLHEWNDPHMWNRMVCIVSALSLIMFLCSLRFRQSPGWSIVHGRIAEAEDAVHHFLGDDVQIDLDRQSGRIDKADELSWRDMFRGDNLRKVIFGGLPWACEGLGVYGIGVFLPALIMALGLAPHAEEGYGHIIDSVELTTYINIAILPGFILGLCLVNRWYHVRTQTLGFILCALGLAILLTAYELHWPRWIAIGGFMIFELFLNAGPHLMTFIIPSQIYSVAERGSGTGISAACGKAGAVIGVFFMPLLLKWGGVELVMGVTIAVQLIGAAVTYGIGRKVLPPEQRHG
ncbi:MAG: MFS transporter [Alistipes sp.]|nr:MFS transporter [Alistipes sp.]